MGRYGIISKYLSAESYIDFRHFLFIFALTDRLINISLHLIINL